MCKNVENKVGHRNKITHCGFTLIELLVVVLIIGILAAVALPQYQKAVEKTHAAEALIVIDNIEKTLELDVLEHGMPIDAQEIVQFTNRFLNDGLLISHSGLENKKGRGLCSSNGFCYTAYCGVDTCRIEAEYRKGKKTLYTLGARKNFKNQGKWELTCMFTAAGKKVNACGIFQGIEQLDCTPYYDEEWEEYVSECDDW